MNTLLQLAVDHRNKSLMKLKGWQPWQKLVQSRQKQEEIADAAFMKCCLRLVKAVRSLCFTLHLLCEALSYNTCNKIW